MTVKTLFRKLELFQPESEVVFRMAGTEVVYTLDIVGESGKPQMVYLIHQADGENKARRAENAPECWRTPGIHESLYRSRKGRYYMEHESQGSTLQAELVSDHEAARWLLANGHELPEDLAALKSEVSE